MGPSTSASVNSVVIFKILYLVLLCKLISVSASHLAEITPNLEIQFDDHNISLTIDYKEETMT